MCIDQALAGRVGMSDAAGPVVRAQIDADLAELAAKIELEEQTRYARQATADGEGGAAPPRKRDVLRAGWGVTAARAAGAGDAS